MRVFNPRPPVRRACPGPLQPLPHAAGGHKPDAVQPAHIRVRYHGKTGKSQEKNTFPLVLFFSSVVIFCFHAKGGHLNCMSTFIIVCMPLNVQN